MIRLCEHIFRTNFVVLSPNSKSLWLFAATHAEADGILHININVLPGLVALSKEQGLEAIEELGKHNFFDDDQPPFLSRCQTEQWNISRVLHWRCSGCEPIYRAFIPLEIRQDVLAIGICAHCEATENLEVDHIRPVSLGGTSDRENLQPLCATCNRSKRNRFIG